MNFNIFKVNEIVQAVDETTWIWEEAKVISVVSDWTMRLKWVNWASSPPVTIVVRMMGFGCWNVRKPQKIYSPPSNHQTGRTLRNASQQPATRGPFRAFTTNPRNLVRDDTVIFQNNFVQNFLKSRWKRVPRVDSSSLYCMPSLLGVVLGCGNRGGLQGEGPHQ